MRKIVIVSEKEGDSSDLKEMVQLVFPECRILVVDRCAALSDNSLEEKGIRD